jgi:hypothetical protein
MRLFKSPWNPQRGQHGQRGQRGQALVEFALIIMVFMTVIVAICEFAFLLTVKTGIAFASQDATQLAAELGSQPDADCYILKLIDKDLLAPVNKANIQSVKIFYTNSSGAVGVSDNWSKGGTYHCDNLNIDIPWVAGAQNYPPEDRCNILSAVGCDPHTSLDWIGVTITYRYSWITPLPSLAGLSSSPPIFTETHISRVEPVL